MSKPLSEAIDLGSGMMDQTGIPLLVAEKVEEEDMSLDYNFAKNLLESFQSQGGNSGPGSNLMGMLGTTTDSVKPTST